MEGVLLYSGEYSEALQVCQCAKCRMRVSIAIIETPADYIFNGLAWRNPRVLIACF